MSHVSPRPADSTSFGKLLAQGFKPAGVLGGLRHVPRVDRERSDSVDVGFGLKRVAILGHTGSTGSRKAVFRPETVEHPRLGVRAGVALCDRSAQLGQLSLLAALLMLKGALAPRAARPRHWRSDGRAVRHQPSAMRTFMKPDKIFGWKHGHRIDWDEPVDGRADSHMERRLAS